MSLACAVCGNSRVTNTVETETGIKALCDSCFAPVAEQARKEKARDDSVRRFYSHHTAEP